MRGFRLFILYIELRNCKRLESLSELPQGLSKLDAENCERLNYLESSSSTVIEGNIFEFIFTNCSRLLETNQILAYLLLKFQLYTKRLYHHASLVFIIWMEMDWKQGSKPREQGPKAYDGIILSCIGPLNSWRTFKISSSCLPEDATPEWFSHQSWGSTVTCQQSSHWANNEFLGFCLCAVIASDSFNFELQVKCTYHMRNEHGDSHDLYRYLYDEFDERAHQLRKHSYEI
ncbi:hypothetical protein NC652_041269 [Populus alba x Populus x berolinensis]|nr:hypothetical protein NC652_041269 [Populus alba x Populus x berolinensis]